jgi:hypothetical protein
MRFGEVKYLIRRHEEANFFVPLFTINQPGEAGTKKRNPLACWSTGILEKWLTGWLRFAILSCSIASVLRAGRIKIIPASLKFYCFQPWFRGAERRR